MLGAAEGRGRMTKRWVTQHVQALFYEGVFYPLAKPGLPGSRVSVFPAGRACVAGSVGENALHLFVVPAMIEDSLQRIHPTVRPCRQIGRKSSGEFVGNDISAFDGLMESIKLNRYSARPGLFELA